MCAVAPEPVAIQIPPSTSQIRPQMTRPKKKAFIETDFGIIIIGIAGLFWAYIMFYTLPIPEEGPSAHWFSRRFPLHLTFGRTLLTKLSQWPVSVLSLSRVHIECWVDLIGSMKSRR